MADSKINLEQVRHVARLARLRLTSDEEQRIGADLNSILEYVAKLSELETNAVEPTGQVGEAGTPFREDVLTNEPAAEKMLANAPAREGTFFKVPKILE